MKSRTIRANSILVEDILFEVKDFIVPGATVDQINQKAKNLVEKAAFIPSTHVLGYNEQYISVGINAEIFFSELTTEIKQGDVVKLALGGYKDGYFTDMALTFVVAQEDNELVIGTASAMMETLSVIKEGTQLKTLSTAIFSSLGRKGLSPICEVLGHGIGKNLHEPPSLANCPNLPYVDYTSILESGMVLCVEPIATTGSGKVLKNGKLNIETADKHPAAHFEFPVLVEKNGCRPLNNRLYEFVKKLQNR